MDNVANQPDSWKSDKLKSLPIDLIDGDRSSRYPKRDEFQDTGIVFLNTTNIVDNRLDFSGVNYISEEKFAQLRKGKLRPLDIVMTTRGSIGKIAVFNHSAYRTGFINAQMLIIRADGETIDNKFLYYLLCSDVFQERLKNFSSGAAQPQIPIKDLREIEVDYPPLPTQKKITAILSAYDDLIENNTRRIQILEEMAQTIYRQWFVEFKYPGHESVPLVESGTELGMIPRGWEASRLDEALVLQRGFDLPKKKRVSGNIPIFAATGVVGTHNERKVKAPGVVTGRSGSLGTVIYIDEDYWPLNTTLWVKEFRKATPLFAYYLLDGMDLQSLNSGAAVPSLNRNYAHAQTVIIPPTRLLQEFDNHVLPMHNLMRTLRDKNTNLRATRDLLLPRLVSGEVGVEGVAVS